ncbi:hypothetical protein EMIT0P218_80043 [Pseudomonas sp. IT-P218]
MVGDFSHLDNRLNVLDFGAIAGLADYGCADGELSRSNVRRHAKGRHTGAARRQEDSATDH